MSKRKTYFNRFRSALGVATAMLGLAAAGEVQAAEELLFRDTFDVTFASDDINSEFDTRQSGAVAPVFYTLSGAGFAQLGYEDAPNKLKLTTPNVLVSPDHNFTEGSSFTIEFEIDPGINDGSEPLSGDWSAIVFGASAPNMFVNASDGVGILFRNNGAIQVFDGGAAVYGGTADLAIPTTEPFNVRIEVDSEGFGLPATVSMFVNETQARLHADSLELVKSSGFDGNYLTLIGQAEAANQWVSTFDNLEINADGCVDFLTHEVAAQVGTSIPVFVQIPPSAVASGSANVTVRALNPGIAKIAGATGSDLVLPFSTGTYSAQVNIDAVSSGVATFELVNDRGVCVGQPLSVLVLSSFVLNPSFEKNYNPAGAHYSPIDDWLGGSGVNTSSGPFHDSGVIPDQERLAFIQGGAALSQFISGLDPAKQYWIQFFYNTRGCCGDRTLELTTSFGGVPLDTIPNVQPAGGVNPMHFRNVAFTPGIDSGELRFGNAVTGDATSTIDAVTVVQRDEGNVIIMNPSFEASGMVPAPGHLTVMAGWSIEGQAGVNFNGTGVYADNGKNPDQDNVAFIEGASSITQVIPRLVTGESYTLSFAYNAASGNTPHLQVKLDGEVVFEEDVTPVGGNAAYRTKEIVFTAENPTVELSFAQTVEGAQTVLIDDVRLEGVSVSLPCLTVAPGKAELAPGQTVMVTATIPSALTATEPATLRFRSSNTAVATLVGADANGVLAVTFEAGGVVAQSFEATAVARGAANIEIVDSAGLCTLNGVALTVVSSYVRNPSFEADPRPGGVGYGPVGGWVNAGGNIGINTSTGPFADNGMIPDRAQVALVQGTSVVSQQVSGLTPNQPHWLQFRYNIRNCCGEPGLFGMDLVVRFAGVDIAYIPGIGPVGGTSEYLMAQIEFTPTEGSGALELATTALGDATLLLDAFSIVPRAAGGVVVENPSFEASGTASFPGYLQPAPMAGWAGEGQYGVNVSPIGPFADNGLNPDQDSVAFLQGESSLTQVIQGLTPGENYTVSLAVNARTGNSPRLRLSADGTVMLETAITPAGGNNPYLVLSAAFTAADTMASITIAQTVGGDQTMLIDNVRIVPGGEVAPALQTTRLADGRVRISWPASAEGYAFQRTSALPGGWETVSSGITTDGAESVFITAADGDAGFFRLMK